MTVLSEIAIEKIQHSRLVETDFDRLQFGKVLSDHMFSLEYSEGVWHSPKVLPFGPVQMYPSSAVLHYGQAIFEGLKAYLNPEGRILLFRPELHEKRLQNSSERMCIPRIPDGYFLDGLKALLEVDKAWIPKKDGSSLYIRPILYATEEALGVHPSDRYSFFIITSPVASYYAGTVKVLVEDEYCRAAEGGTGSVKAGGNYAASLLPAKLANEKGYDQILWTDAATHTCVEEIGTMNVMFQIDGKIITPDLSSSILPGITRRSVIELAQHWGVEIEERQVRVEELIEAHHAGTLQDAFGTGTAATITNINTIGYKGNDYVLPSLTPDLFSVKAQEYLNLLKVGQAEDYMGWMTLI